MQIEKLKTNNYPSSLIHSENLKLFENIVTLFSDSASTFEIEILEKANHKRKTILQNLQKLDKYEDNTYQKQLLNDYFNYAMQFTKILIQKKEKNININTIILLQEKRKQTFDFFLNKKQKAYLELENSLEYLSSNTKSFFTNLLVLSSFGSLTMILIALYFYLSVKKRFTKVISMMENLATNKPDFSKSIEIDEYNDELTTLVKWFEHFKIKLKNDYDLLNDLKLKAEETAKIKSEFLANMSHEIRTPINGIIGMIHLTKQTQLNLDQERYIQNIDNSSSSLLRIINDILDFSKLEAGKVNIDTIDFNLRKLVSNAMSIVEFSAKEKKLKLDVFYDENIEQYLHGDSLRISQILINLLSNAVKFTEKGFVRLEISSFNSLYTFKIIDTGIGINQKQQENLFHSFSQADGSTSRKYGGTGLGLSISKQLVELMGGKITLNSQIEKGSEFVFELVLKKSFNTIIVKDIQENKLKDIHDLAERTILLVEDNTINQEIIIGLLKHSKINIDIAPNGKEALKLFENNSLKYKLILMDLQMPIMDGFEATKHIREKDLNIPIIALTANAMKEDIEKTHNLGMNEHINKPIQVEQFYETLLKYLKIPIEGQKTIQESNIPQFRHIDTEIGLSHMGGDEKLYYKILTDFYNKYNILEIETLDSKMLQLTAHTIKGLSANIGALSLSQIAKDIEETLDISLFDKFNQELYKVLNDLQKIQKGNKNPLIINDKKIEELYLLLKKFISKRKAKQCHEVLDELEAYHLKDTEKEKILQLKILLQHRNYKKMKEIF